MHRLLEPMIARFYHEKRSLGTFFLIGVSCVFLTMGGYALLSRVFWPTGPRMLEYAITVILVTYINYEANRSFTFRGTRTKTTLTRFAAVAITAFALQNLVFWVGHDVLHLWDMGVIVASSGAVALFTFSSHRLFTFRSKA